MIQIDHIPTSLKQVITPELAWRYMVVPYKEEQGITRMLRSENAAAVDSTEAELEVILGRPIALDAYPEDQLRLLLGTHFISNKERTGEKLEMSLQGDFLEKLIHEAKNLGSSDIHIENYGDTARVRLRLDGVLIERYTLDPAVYSELVNKVKIRANLDIAEKRLPQDGRIEIRAAGKKFDLRVSTLPTLKHEKIVLRILSNDASHLNLDDLGFSDRQLHDYREAIRKPNGIILISGPTGSGKTTTLYATLKQLNDGKRNIVTAEDPVEYTLSGINQVHLNENIGYTFAKALRSFLRQDPDIIMVGEIRDPDTANMAVKASLTGHLVLSTVHTNSAWGTVSRLIDMGVPGYLLANTLSISMAQRLVRKLCPHCKQPVTAHRDLFPDNWDKYPETTLYAAKGCGDCHYTGYKGRVAIYEIIPIDRDLATMIRSNQMDASEILPQKEIRLLSDQAFDLLCKGITSTDEVYTLLMQT
jgi:type II secretory ATPase GspE/PulE/Tfp pilus assembly ATPase PilB-like protein